MRKEPTFVPKNLIDKNGNALYPAYHDVPIEMLSWDKLYDFSYQIWEYSVITEGENNTLKEEKKELVLVLVVVSVILLLVLAWFLTNFWSIVQCFS